MSVEAYKTVIEKVRELNPKATLVAVSKTYPSSDISAIYQAGHRDFGENRVQELVKKMDELPKDIRWHLIGHLQKNKVKYLVGRVHLIHSVDSISLAQKIDSESAKKNVITSVLLQVNLAKEEQKSGVYLEEFEELIKYCSKLPHLKVMGLMLIPPFEYNEVQLADIFDETYQLSLDIIHKKIDNIDMQVLSYGMSEDFQLAIEHGSNMVRVGSSIFGSRDK